MSNLPSLCTAGRVSDSQRYLRRFFHVFVFFTFTLLNGLASFAMAADIEGVVNFYAKGVGEVAEGATTVQISNVTKGVGTIEVGDTLLMLQSQGALIDASNTNRYGDGVGDGSQVTTTPTSQHGTDGYAGGIISQSAGTFEYVVVAAYSGNTITLSTGTENSYSDAGEANWQVVLVPDYQAAGAKLTGDISALPWDGDIGGVVAFSASGGVINFNGFKVNAAALGFRGGIETETNSTTNDVAAVTVATSDAGGKGEGIAGTPRRVWDGNTIVDEGVSTLLGGDFGRGAPGNAGGGAGPHNSGGGGGSNAGRGGTGAQGWVGGTPVHYGGYGGQSIFAGANMGGGGGAGEGNNLTITHGGIGGGVVLIRAQSAVGSGTVDVSGGDGAVDPVSRGAGDGAGGGGAGGSAILFFDAPTNLPGLTIDARGGDGEEGDPSHGGGGGGGGGYVAVRASVGSILTNAGVGGANHGDGGVPSEAGGAGVAITGSNAFIVLNTDWGDAPKSYGTISGANGAYHTFADINFDGIIGPIERVFLGSNVDGEAGGNPSDDANSDDTSGVDDEDGFSNLVNINNAVSSFSIAASDIRVTNTLSTAATLHAWLDFDNNGTFDSDEYSSVPIANNLTNAAPSTALTWNSVPGLISVPVGETLYLRARITSDPTIDADDPDGLARNGEVEDYALAVISGPHPTLDHINRLNPSDALTNADQLVFSVIFSDNVTGVSPANFSISGAGSPGASVAAVTGSGRNYSVTVNVAASAAGEVDLNLTSGASIKNHLNRSVLSLDPTGNDQTYLLENTAPNVSILNVPAYTNGSFVARFEFSENVSGFTQNGIVVGNASLSSFTSLDSKTYTALITPTNTGFVTIDVPAGRSQDDAGNTNLAATQAVSNYDPSAPTAALKNAPHSVTNRDAFGITLQFSKLVSGVELSDVDVANGVASNLVRVNGDTYTLQITPSGQGDIRVFVPANSASDNFGNSNLAASPAIIILDSDGDGISDSDELAEGSNPNAADSDGDGIPDDVESSSDSDGDGLIDRNDSDSDNDGISDANEVGDVALTPRDSDNDGIIDMLDRDSDNDGIPDAVEGNADTDGDGITNQLDLDSDGDGLPDAVEDMVVKGSDADNDGIDDGYDVDLLGGNDADKNGVQDDVSSADNDGDGKANFLDIDSDNDGISDTLEADINLNMDLDGDQINDKYDVDSTSGTDRNGDGIDDAVTPTDTDGDLIPDYLDLDTDNDSLLDVIEAGGTDADFDGIIDNVATNEGSVKTPTDSDRDGIGDWREVDSDNDGTYDIEQGLHAGTDANKDGVIDQSVDQDKDGLADAVDRLDGFGAASDADGDGILDAVEGNEDTDGDGLLDANDTDSDNDGIDDADEVGADKGNPADFDGDGIPNYKDEDSDNDGIRDALEGTADLNGNGKPDYLDNEGRIETALEGNGAGSADLVILVLFGLLCAGSLLRRNV